MNIFYITANDDCIGLFVEAAQRNLLFIRLLQILIGHVDRVNKLYYVTAIWNVTVEAW